MVAMTDQFPDTLRPRKALFTLAVCVGYFLVGLPQLTQVGKSAPKNSCGQRPVMSVRLTKTVISLEL